MNKKPTYEYIFDLLDYADDLVELIPTVDDFERNQYFVTLVYIEDILDIYGRGLVLHSANDKEEGTGRELMGKATKRMDELRDKIHSLMRLYEFDSSLDEASKRIATRWRKQRS